jgi:hypothetical protein
LETVLAMYVLDSENMVLFWEFVLWGYAVFLLRHLAHR